MKAFRLFLFSACSCLVLWAGTPWEARGMPPVDRQVLPSQLVLLVSEQHQLPFLTLELLINAGSWRDPPGQEGLAYITAKSLLLGTTQRSAGELNEALDSTGTHLSSEAGQDYASLSLRVLKKHLDHGLQLFLEVLTKPVFPDMEIRKEIAKTLAAIKAADDIPREVAEKAFQKALYRSSPYAHPVEGTKESLSQLRRDMLEDFYDRYYRPNDAILAVVGDVTPEEVRTKIIAALESWPPGPLPPTSFESTFAAGPQDIKIDRNLTQTNIIVGQPGVRRDNPDYYTLSVMNYILGGGGFVSRLVGEVREKRGLAYSVSSALDPGRYAGSFQIALQTKNPSAKEAIRLSLLEMERMRNEWVGEKELEGAKRYLIGSFPMRLDTQGKLAHFLSQVEYYGLGLDYPEAYPALINSVSREGIQQVARKYLHPEERILVVVGNLKEAQLE